MIALSFDELARDLSSSLRRYLWRLVGDEALAEDLLQDTLLRIDRGLPSFDGRSSPKTWAFSIATHAAADYFRKPERRLAIVDVTEAENVADSHRSMDDGMVTEEMNACIRHVIDSLPEDYRAALVLHDMEGLTAEETASVCGCSLATAKIRIHRARDRLRKALQDQCEFYRENDSTLRCTRVTPATRSAR